MKNLLFLLAFLVAVPSWAYQAGQQNRTNFSSSQQAQSGQQYRSFSNYSNRNWGQGVQTQGVQTEVAGKSAKELKPMVGKQQAAAPKKSVRSTQPVAPTAVPAQASTAPAAMPANVDPAAMMQQVQGMMNTMGNMTGGTQGQAGQNAAAAMPAGMPDISALMGGAMPTAPAATPAKK